MHFKNAVIALSATIALIFGAVPAAYAANCGGTFPTALDNCTTGETLPASTINSIEGKIGANQSTVTSSLDYQINHIFTSYGSEQIASSAIPWLASSSATSTIAIGSSTVNGPAFTFATSTASGKWTIAASGTTITYTIPSNVGFFTNDAGYLTGNQSITWTAAGDISGFASGATTITPTLTVTGLNGKALPSLSQGVLIYTGSAWSMALPLGSAYGGTATTTALGSNAFTSGGFPSIATTSKSIYDQNPATSTDFIQFLVNAPATTTITDVDCYNDNAAGNTFTFNIAVSSTVTTGIVPASSSLVFGANQTCTATSTVYSTSTFSNATIGKGKTAWLLFTAASSTGAHVQIDF